MVDLHRWEDDGGPAAVDSPSHDSHADCELCGTTVDLSAPVPYQLAPLANGPADSFGTTADPAYARPASPQAEWDTDGDRYKGREDILRKFILAGVIVGPEGTGLVRLSANQLRRLWAWVQKIAGQA